MLAVRYLYVLALVIWLGGMIVAGAIVAPATFRVLESADPTTGRVLAGQVFGEILKRFNLVAYAAAAVLLLALVVQRLVGPRPRAAGIRAGIIVLMLGATMYSGLVLTPRIDALQRAVSGPVNRLPADDARRQEFDRLHGISETLLSAAAFGGLLLLGWETRE
ncbi:MAG: DUF4149 domain-containing protein [Vicinamibacterales bacterium]